MGRCALVFLALTLGGCLGLVPMPDEPLSLGVSNHGVLHDGVALPDRGEGYVRGRPGESTRFGTPELIATLERAIVEVNRRFPGTAPMRIGDLSAPSGGRHHRHGSHRTGLDADLIFYLTDPAGRSHQGRGWLAYNRFGFAVDDVSSRGGLYFFDDARNWWFVRTLLLDEESAVQWIFVSNGVKSQLLRYAIAHEQDPRAIVRAAYVLQEPSNASPHDDHFHVRIYCPPRALAHGCINRGFMWPWLRGEIDKPPAILGQPLTDDVLVHALYEGLTEPSAAP